MTAKLSHTKPWLNLPNYQWSNLVIDFLWHQSVHLNISHSDTHFSCFLYSQLVRIWHHEKEKATAQAKNETACWQCFDTTHSSAMCCPSHQATYTHLSIFPTSINVFYLAFSNQLSHLKTTLSLRQTCFTLLATQKKASKLCGKIRSALPHRRKPTDYEQIVVAPACPGVSTMESQLNDENVDYASRHRYHHSTTLQTSSHFQQHCDDSEWNVKVSGMVEAQRSCQRVCACEHTTLPSVPKGKISRRQELTDAWPLFIIPGYNWMFSSMLKAFHTSATEVLSWIVKSLLTCSWWTPACINPRVLLRLPQDLTKVC